jgi:phage tail sheath protein FI
MAQLKTPDVYIREKSLLPPSVAEVATAVPAFIGFTQNIVDNTGQTTTNIPFRFSSLSEYEALFGTSQMENFEVSYNNSTDECYITNGEQGLPSATDVTFFLHQAIQHFYANGGGTCYVVSISDHNTVKANINASEFIDAINLLEEVDEVTLISAPESVLMDTVAHYSVQNHALQHCEKMKDRFALVDVQQADGFNRGDLSADVPMVRDQVTNGLKYGGAYYPYVRTTMARSYDEATVNVSYSLTLQKLHDNYKGAFVDKDGETLNEYGLSTGGIYKQTYIQVGDLGVVDKMGYLMEYVDGNFQRKAATNPYGIFTNEDGDYLNYQGFVIDSADSNILDPTNTKKKIATTTNAYIASLEYLSDPKWRLASTSIHSKVKSMLSKNYLVLPPSAAVAGVIAKVDGSRGVWKAPANVALAKVLEPCVAIDNGEQADMNVDVTAGKSINAIRSFVGKGSLVWGARTLQGNDNEWRYISVRRLFNMVEESVQKASHFAVFEPNTPFTWLKLKTMIENYLENLWRQGALFGETPAAAFFVNVGLGQTMTEDDINNGLMNIEIGLAAVRPAEFIILTFSHKSLEG